MIRCSSRVLLPFAALCAWALGPSAWAQALPKGEEILDKYVAATGGKAAYEKYHNRVTRGSMEIAGAGLKGKITICTAAPNKMYTEIELPGVGTIEEGTDGTVAWGINPTTGPRIKDGPEKDAALRRAEFNGQVNWRKQFKKAECVGVDTVEGKPCYKVELTTKDGQVRTHYYDRATYLLVKSTGTEKTPNGDIPVESLIGDYKKVDEILLPFKTRQKALANEIVITVDKVEHNVKLPENRFALPDEIKKLAGKPGK